MCVGGGGQLEESLSTCRFAQRVACVSNAVRVNEEVDPQLVITRLKQARARARVCARACVTCVRACVRLRPCVRSHGASPVHLAL